MKFTTNQFAEQASITKDWNVNVPEPVFIIGSYRSGTSILTWALGQHSSIFPLEETNWIYRLGVYLDCLFFMGSVNGRNSHLSSTGIPKLKFYKSFGKMIHSLILDNRVNYLKSSLKFHLDKANLPAMKLDALSSIGDFAEYSDENDLFSVIRNKDDSKHRWVDGTPENSHFVYCLNLLFPNAKFIFLLRNPIKVAHSLINFATTGGTAQNYEEQQAYEQWYGLTESCYYALKAFGSGKVLLVEQEKLVLEKYATIQQCLSFLGEKFEAACLKPLNATINSSQYDKSGIDFSIGAGRNSKKEYVKKACGLYDTILQDSTMDHQPSMDYYRKLRNRYNEHAKSFY